MSTQPEMRPAHRLYERLGFARASAREWALEPGLDLRFSAREVGPNPAARASRP